MQCRRSRTHAVSTGQTDFPVKFHGENTPALPGVRKGKSGRLLRRPQPDHPAATVDEFCTAVLTDLTHLALTLAIRLVAGAGEWRDGHTLTVTLVAQSGDVYEVFEKRLRIAQAVDLDSADEIGYLLPAYCSRKSPRPGTFHFVVSVDGRPHAEVPLKIVEVPGSGWAPQISPSDAGPRPRRSHEWSVRPSRRLPRALIREPGRE